MRPFTPTLGARDTSKNVKEFVKDNKEIFWKILKPLLPWIVGLHLVDAVLTAIFFAESERGFALGSLVASYFYTCLVITWHRVVIHGPDNYITMNPFKPKRHELVFIGMGILLTILGGLLVALSIAAFLIHAVLGVLAVITALLGITYLGYKFCFYFPAKAVDNSIKLKDSFYLTQGYFWTFMGAVFLAPLKYIFFLLLYFIIAFPILGGIIMMTSGSSSISIIANLLGFAISIPIIAYLIPLLYVIGVTVLSNYYQHAIQNKTLPTPNDKS